MQLRSGHPRRQRAGRPQGQGNDPLGSASESVPAEVRLYDRLFSVEQPGADGVDFLTQLNADSLKVVTGRLEPELAKLASGSTVQFERLGYFTVDPDSAPGKPGFQPHGDAEGIRGATN